MAGVRSSKTPKMSLTVEKGKKGRTCTAQQAPCQILAMLGRRPVNLAFASPFSNSAPFLKVIDLGVVLRSFNDDEESEVNAPNLDRAHCMG